MKTTIDSISQAARDLLNSTMTEKTAAELKALHGIVLPPEATNKEALDAVIVKKAKEGDPEYMECAIKYGLLPDGEPDE